jgi:glyoxylase-like metal-dependent hydrolase (beta-lactamase superfamily II)
VRGGVRRIVLLTLGWEELPKSVSVHGAPADERLREPVPGVLLECSGGWLLLDTGDPLYRPVLPGPGEPLEEALASAGIDLADIHAVAVSHLHSDHAGGLKHFAGRVPVHVQDAELAYGLSGHPAPESHSIYRVDFDDPRIDWRRADGDVEIAPGVTAVLTAGHTPGHQSFVVDLEGGGGFVFAFDAADLAENIDGELPVGSTIDVDPAATVEPIRRLKHIAAERGYRLIPGHDPDVWPNLTAELAARADPG